jgi:prophage antirepressor-like protein
MNEPVVYEFNRQPVPMHRHEGDLWVTSEHIGAALGYAEPNRAITKIYNRNREELDLHTCTPKLVHQAEDGIEQRRSVRCFNEEGIMIITMLSRQPKAAEFRAWAVKILKAYRHGELVLNQPSERDHLLELCISEAGKCNIAALSTLVSRYGYEPSIKEQQLKILGCRWRPRIRRCWCAGSSTPSCCT